jgi:hypothetical protein
MITIFEKTIKEATMCDVENEIPSPINGWLETTELTLAEARERADDIWEAYAGSETPYVEDKQRFIEWAGGCGEEIASEIDWLIDDDE